MTTTEPAPAYVELPDEVLEKAKSITLLDLLDCPPTQCWTVSMLSNVAANSSAYAALIQQEDTLLLYQLNNVFQSIHPSSRHTCYKQIRAHRAQHIQKND